MGLLGVSWGQSGVCQELVRSPSGVCQKPFRILLVIKFGELIWTALQIETYIISNKFLRVWRNLIGPLTDLHGPPTNPWWYPVYLLVLYWRWHQVSIWRAVQISSPNLVTNIILKCFSQTPDGLHTDSWQTPYWLPTESRRTPEGPQTDSTELRQTLTDPDGPPTDPGVGQESIRILSEAFQDFFSNQIWRADLKSSPNWDLYNLQ